MKSLSRFLCLFWIVFIIEEREASSQAVIAISKTEGFKLSEKAIQTLGVKTGIPTSFGQSVFEVPSESLVYSEFRVGIYRLREDWFKFIEVDRVHRLAPFSRVHTKEFNSLRSQDRVAIQGAPLLRVVEMEEFDRGEK